MAPVTWTLWARMTQTSNLPIQITAGPLAHLRHEHQQRRNLPSYSDFRIGRQGEPFDACAPATDY